ncbi:MAG: LysM peptidoglycan-binding domain-containing protein [Chitinophagales bacterium]
MLIVIFAILITYDLQAQINSNEQKTTTETMPKSQLKTDSKVVPMNNQKDKDKTTQNSEQNKNPKQQDDKSKNNRKTKNKKTTKNETKDNSNKRTPKDKTTQPDGNNKSNKQDKNDVLVLDSLLNDAIGNRNKEIIEKATQVRLYAIEPFISDEKQTTTLKDFKILEERTLNKQQIQPLVQLLTSTDTYCTGSLIKQCLFMPKMAVEFVYGKERTHILLSLSCDVVRFYHDNNIFKTLNSDVAHNDIAAFYESMFPKESTSLQNMSLTSNQTPIFYIAQNGDSLSKIAEEVSKSYNLKVTTAMLQEWNDYKNPNKLNIGDRLIVGFHRTE